MIVRDGLPTQFQKGYGFRARCPMRVRSNRVPSVSNVTCGHVNRASAVLPRSCFAPEVLNLGRYCLEGTSSAPAYVRRQAGALIPNFLAA